MVVIVVVVRVVVVVPVEVVTVVVVVVAVVVVERCRGTCTAHNWAWLRAQKRPPLTGFGRALRNLEHCATHALFFDAVAICCNICSGSCCCVV